MYRKWENCFLGNWYIYDDHRWKQSKSTSSITSERISAKLMSLYDQLISFGKHTKMDNEKIKGFKKIKTSLGNVHTKKDIIH